MIPKQLIREINYWIESEKFGHIQINFIKGRIININRTQSVKMNELEPFESQVVQHNGMVSGVPKTPGEE